jgi:hypothetical protein
MAMGDRTSCNQSIFKVLDGDIRIWVEPDEAIYMIIDSKYRAPVELTSKMGKQLAAALLEMADRLED